MSNAEIVQKIESSLVLEFSAAAGSTLCLFVQEKKQADALVENFGDFLDGNKTLRCVDVHCIGSETAAVDLAKFRHVSAMPYGTWIAMLKWRARYQGELESIRALAAADGDGGSEP